MLLLEHISYLYSGESWCIRMVLGLVLQWVLAIITSSNMQVAASRLSSSKAWVVLTKASTKQFDGAIWSKPSYVMQGDGGAKVGVHQDESGMSGQDLTPSSQFGHSPSCSDLTK